ncbi:MAG: YccF domain-containing protein [Ktedonobacteraceae bacterium]
MQDTPHNMNATVNVTVQQHGGPGFLIRALYFLCIGWWFGFFWLQLGFLLCIFIVTLPIGLVMLNRLPQVLTLRSSGVQVATSTVGSAQMTPGAFAQTVNVNVRTRGTQQASFLVRALYFVFIGWWAAWLWANVGYALCVIIVTLPVGLMMLNRLPAVLTLRRN